MSDKELGDYLKENRFELEHSTEDYFVMRNQDLQLDVIIDNGRHNITFRKEKIAFPSNERARAQYQISRDFLSQTCFNPIEIINDKLTRGLDSLHM